MKKIFLSLILTFCHASLALAQWVPVGDRIKTKWADEIDVNSVLPEYPRPLMERTDWVNLNGLWDYRIAPVGQSGSSVEYDGQILVPFAVESSLSGVGKTVGDKNELWYRRVFNIPDDWKSDKRIIGVR